MTANGDRRIVVVVGRQPGVFPVEATAVPGGARLIVLAVGWPLTDRQQQAVDEAKAVARTAQVVLDAILVSSSRAAAAHVLPDDDVFVAAHESEARRVRRALASARVSVRATR